MIKKIFSIFVAFFLIFSFLGVVKASDEEMPQAKEVSSFEMFWPIVAGRTKGSPLYPLKILKEKVRGFLIFGPYKKADYYITLSEKRVVEAEKLILENSFKNANKTFDMAKVNREKGLKYVEKAQAAGIDVANLKNRFLSSIEKQTLLLESLAKKTEEGSNIIKEDISQMSSISENLK